MTTRALIASIFLVMVACSGGSDSKPDASAVGSDSSMPDAAVDAGPPPTFDTCAGAEVLTFANGIAAGTADLTGAKDDTAASCGGAGGPDAVFKFTTPANGNLVIDVRPTQGSARPILSVRSDCGAVASQIGGCVSAQTAGGASLLVLPFLTAGTYYLWIDSADAQTARYDVSMTLSTGAGDACASPVLLPVTGGEGNAASSTVGSTDDNSSSCGGAGSLDNVYRIDLADVANVDLSVTPTSVGMQPIVYMESTCAGSDYSCAAAGSAGANASMRLGSVPAGTHYIWVDSANATPGIYELTAHVSAPVSGDTCGNAQPLTFTNGTATVTGDLTNLFNDATGSCSGGGTSPDAVYSFTTASVQNLQVSVTTSDSAFRPAVYLRSASCTGSEVACNAATTGGASGTLSVGGLAAGTYYLWVDGAAGTTGSFTLTATATTPTQGDTCALAKTLTFTNGSASDSGNTSLWFNDSSGTCATGSSPDGVYMFTTTGVQDFHVVVSSLTSTYQPAVYLRSASCTGTQLACTAAASMGGSATLDAGGLAAGTYYLWIDGANSTSGLYTLSATLTTPPPGEHCTNPAALTFTSGTATATGDTTMNFNDSAGTCISGTSPDVVYSFSTTAVQDLRVTVSTTTSTYQPAVYLRSASCTGSQLACSTAVTTGGSATLAVGALPIGTYYLWIDGANGTAGAWSLNATLSTPVSGERCTNPEALVFSNGQAGGTATAMGDTTNMFDDASGTCGGSGASDAVYSFTTNKPLDLTVAVATTTSTFRPTVYLRSASCTGTQLGCAIATSTGGTANLSVQSLTAGTYYLWVDGGSTAGGLYTVSATLADLPPAAVRAVQPSDVTVPGPMAVTYQVVDRLGNLVTTDNSTKFTISTTGSAVIAAATTGTIVSGAGTNSVVVQVSGGVVTVSATDATAETVTYTATDSQGNGLAYPSGTATQSAPSQTIAATNTFNMSFAQRPSGNGTLTITAFGDFDASTEYLNVYMESTAGTYYGQVFVVGNQCGSTLTANVTIPQADLMTHLSDGVATVVTTIGPDVNPGLCYPAAEPVSVSLTFPTTNSAKFTP